MMSTFTPADWRDIRLVAFDVDGTLYRQGPLRLRMGRDMVLHTVATCDLNAISVVSAYRSHKRAAGCRGAVDFDRVLIAETAKATSRSPESVQAIVCEWIETRPLRYLRSCLFPGVPQLFAGLQRAGKSIGIFSDYPATEKLAAMGLQPIMSSRRAMSGCLNLMPGASSRLWPQPVRQPAQIAMVLRAKGPESEY
jgi:putative hydrolase of the HAD superfamily